MNSQVVIAFVACFVAANAGVLVGPSAQILQGPSSKTTLVGPDGSAISAVAPGGQIVHEEHPGYVAHSAPVLSYAAAHHGHVAHSGHVLSHHAPIVAHSAHVVSHHAPIVAHSAHVVAHHAPVVAHAVAHHVPAVAHSDHVSTVVAHSSAYGSEDVVVAGPSGTVTTSKHAAPVVAHHAPVVAHHAPIVAHHVAHHVPIVAHHAPAVAYAADHDHGHEGEYVHDYSESLYDDGSYKPYAHEY